jgi:hypothetical protein
VASLRKAGGKLRKQPSTQISGGSKGIMTMFQIPTYDIVFWYYLKPETEKYKDRAVILAEAFPYETTEYEGVQDIHWGTENESEAIAIVERLKVFATDPNVLVLLLKSTRSDFEPMTYKDERQYLK